ncbi:hypothetical protein D3C72_1571750 [compost metagenome]
MRLGATTQATLPRASSAARNCGVGAMGECSHSWWSASRATVMRVRSGRPCTLMRCCALHKLGANGVRGRGLLGSGWDDMAGNVRGNNTTEFCGQGGKTAWLMQEQNCACQHIYTRIYTLNRIGRNVAFFYIHSRMYVKFDLS